ncbi:substrate-binding domain-containing protein [Roseitalea porphyridii]|uniref:Sugar ABC transporter substrate-binding protein n=1 Tax=Roseitalea porphyridii TaxID=1852022 RepID=A0A4P6V5D1_9HYPH|nr:substrate-binding domain-containing protein [Roseitalea porphyridii]QBK31979.1 sugar ABC transporter substrate-binding protein [Roseitalea porphyridii]
MKFTRLLASATIALGFVAGPASADDLTVAGIVFQQDQFFRTIQMGMQAAAEEAGATLLEGNSDSQPDKEISLIDTYIARGVDAIVISPVSGVASIPPLARAKERGIHVVTYNSTIEDDSIPVSYLNSQQRDLGNTTGDMAAAFIRDQLGGEANVATLGFQALLPEISADRVDGFVEKAEEGGTLNIVAQQDAWLAEDAVQVAGDIITANPDLNIIYAANEGGTVGAVQAVRNAGKQGEIFVFGVDGTEQLVGFLLDEDNVLQGVTAQQPFVMGQMAVQSAIAAARGEEVEQTVIVPVLGLSRTDQAGVEEFQDYLRSLN